MNYEKAFSLFGSVVLLGLSVLLYENIEISFSTIVGNADNTALNTKIVIPSTSINLIEDKGILLVNTIVNDKTSLDDSIDFDHSNVRIKVLAGNPNPETFIPKENTPTNVILDPGNYDIQVFLEFDFDEDGIITSIDITDFQDIIVDIEGNRLLELNNCEGSIVEGGQQVCTVEITITDAILAELLGGELEGDLIGNADSDTANQLQGEVEGIVGGALLGTGKLPVDVCKVGDLKAPQQGANIFETDFQPIGATYNFDGKLSLSELTEVLQDSNSKIDPDFPRKGSKQQIVFEILFDNNNPLLTAVATERADAKLTPANSIFKSTVFADREPFNAKDAGFEVKRIWTDCKFTSIAKAVTKYDGSSASSAEGIEIVPLGELGEGKLDDDKGNKVGVPPKRAQVPSDIDKTTSFKLGTKEEGLQPGLSSGLSTSLGKLSDPRQQSILNPPFVTCENKFASNLKEVTNGLGLTQSSNANVISNYQIIGTIDTNEIKNVGGTKDVSLRVTVDLKNKDQAVITNNNNDLIKLNLVIEPGTENAKVVPLPLIEISTDCISLSYANEIVQDF